MLELDYCEGTRLALMFFGNPIWLVWTCADVCLISVIIYTKFIYSKLKAKVVQPQLIKNLI